MNFFSDKFTEHISKQYPSKTKQKENNATHMS